ncbi:MAG: sensor histidine kinase, partial [Myxococcaceae bacterium]
MATEAGYLDELVRQARRRLKPGFFIGTVLLLSFWLLDLVVAAEQRWLFLGMRAGVVLLSGGVALVCLRTSSTRLFRAGVMVAMVMFSALISSMSFFSGGFGSLYSYFVPLPIYCVAVLAVWPFFDGALFVVLSVAFYVGGNLVVLWQGTGTVREALQACSFVVTAAVFSALTIFFSDRVRYADYRLRADLEASVRELNERESRLAAIGRMTSTIAHDLRNPLTTLLGFSELVAEDARGQRFADIAENMGPVLSAGERLRSMLEELLAFARGTGAGLKLAPVPLAKLLDSSLAVVGRELREGSIEVSTELEGVATVEVVADTEAIQRVVENLVRNAGEAIHLRARSEPARPAPVGPVRMNA